MAALPVDREIGDESDRKENVNGISGKWKTKPITRSFDSIRLK